MMIRGIRVHDGDILDTIIKIIFIPRRTRLSRRSNNCSIFLRNSSTIKVKKCLEYLLIDWNTLPWVRSTLSNDRAVELLTAKVYVFSDSVLCLGKIAEYRLPVTSWKDKFIVLNSLQNIVSWIVLTENQSCSSGKISQGAQHQSYFRKSKERWRKNQLEKFKDQIIFMSMYNDIDWKTQETKQLEK